MWPFNKFKKTPPTDVTCGDMTARYNTNLECWVFEFRGIDFQINGVPFNEAAFGWAREAASIIHVLRAEIDSKVQGCLEDWPCDKSKAEILHVDLGDYAETKTITLAFTGDDSWGDFGVDVTITDGKIVAADGGD